MDRRQWLLLTGAGALLPGTRALPAAATEPRTEAQPPGTAAVDRYPPVLPGRPLRFPRDFGAHPPWRTEWWYVTGWIEAGGRALGLQLTFFRSRTGHSDDNPSRFAPTQLLLGHAALAVQGETRLRHAQRAVRAGLGLAGFSEDDTEVAIGDWSLRRRPDDRYEARIAARDFAFTLLLEPPGPPVLQGDAGFSRKGPLPRQASHYYSRPQLRTSGRLWLDAPQDSAGLPLNGRAWLDHEWSSEILDSTASGWDWVGLNLDDGSALMAFRIRGRDGSVRWSHARWIGADGQPDPATPEPGFEPLRHWRSARSGARYPVAMTLTVGARQLRLEPLFDDQELDARASTGTIYWEGAMRVFEDQREVGKGYLELTGYAAALRF